MKRLLLMLPLAFAVPSVMAQSTNTPASIEADNNLKLLGADGSSSPIRLFDNRYVGVKGNPYFKNEWGKAKIAMGNMGFEDVEVKYNLYDNKLLFKNSKGAVYETDPFRIDEMVLQDSMTRQSLVMKRSTALGAVDAALAQRLIISLYEGNRMKLYMVPKKTLVKASYKESYSADRTRDEFRSEEVYYLVGADNKASKVKLSKNSLLKALPDKQNQVEAYITSERIDAGTANGWTKVLAYYESL